MTITSFPYLLLLTVGVLIYYIVPKKAQWCVLLALSLFFYFCAASPATILYLVASTAIAFGAALRMDQIGESAPKRKNLLLFLAIGVNVALWFVLKGSEFWLIPFCRLSGVNRESIHLVAALGMGYYTLQVIGYLIDCYWGNIEPQKNPARLFLFVAYFPQLTTGPISRYSDLQPLYRPHALSYHNITFGAQRILWGFMKKLVLAERLGMIVSSINGNLESYFGFYAWISILLYPLQMYADFSGCMDIVLGTSELFGVPLAENFRNPFFSRTSQEFWQRWHITLGAWAKDYVLYPLLKSSTYQKLNSFLRRKMGKKRGKPVATACGMLVLWLVMGIWHGGYRYIVGVSLWYWTILFLADLFQPFFRRTWKIFTVKPDSFSWHLFQSVHTYLIYAVGAVFFNLGVEKGIFLLKRATAALLRKDCFNIWIFFNGDLRNLISDRDENIILVCLVLLLVVGILREKYGYARVWMQKQGLVFRWSIWLALCLFVLIEGKYGPEYDASAFIYQGF